ncbi:E3 ubiquitin-protein ligase TRIM56-like [Acanthaster planci]|uniref:E3 ubiquitin-protein ligase TRIM56-like n=1 Tax=Acanthaster planci TaxID=133434 RepID=A0A8B7Y8P6_ACAPL|nr:E3 ubiquitin-protein ligase TRIM56-like [Acanthaster planci]
MYKIIPTGEYIKEEMEPHPQNPTELTARSVLEMLTQDFLKCHICLNTFESPTFLDCQHTFCLQCLENLRSSNGRSCNELGCPDCRVKTPLIGRSISALKPNFTMASLVAEVKSQKRMLCIQQMAMIPTCSLCNKANVVILCSDCRERLCQDCWMKQESNHATHKTDVLDLIWTEKSPTVPKCSKHGESQCCYFCQTCQDFICLMCMATLHRSHEHKHLEIDQAYDTARQELGILLSRSEKRLQEYISHKAIIERKCNEMQDEIAEATTKIQQSGGPNKDRYLSKLTEFAQARAAEYSKAMEAACTKVEWVQNIRDTISKRVSSADKYALLRSKEELVLQLRHILEKTVPIPELPTIVYINVRKAKCYKSADFQVTSSNDTWYMDDTEMSIPVRPGPRLYWVQIKL